MAIKNGQSRETGNIDKEKQNKNTTLYVLDTIITQTNTNNVNKNTSPPTNNWRSRRTKHRFYAEMVTDIKTRNSERKDT